jgi:hypothetical protein
VTEPETVDAAHFFDFIGTPGLKVILLSVHPAHNFSQSLHRQLTGEHATMTFGTVGLTDLIVSGGPAIPFLSRGFRECGPSWAFGILPGYCLFRGADMLAWDAGLPLAADASGILRGTLLGVIWSAITNDVNFATQACHFAADHIAAQRVVLKFRQAAADPGPRKSTTAPSGAPPIDDLRWAYQLLRVPPTATDLEVHKAWRRLRIENHPDHAGSDRAEFERRSRVSADINRARDIIVSRRSERGAHTRSAAA